MKKLFLLVAIAALAMQCSAQAALVAGWDRWDVTAASATVGATADFDLITGGSTWNLEFRAGSSDGTFGDLLTGADTTVGTTAPFHYTGIRSQNSSATKLIDFTITDTSGVARDLDFFHFDTIRRGGTGTWALSVLSASAIPTGSVSSGAAVVGFAAENNEGVDVSLAGLTLEANGNVTFRLDLGATGNHQELDNVAISSVAVPEPSSFALLGLGCVGMLARRKKK